MSGIDKQTELIDRCKGYAMSASECPIAACEDIAVEIENERNNGFALFTADDIRVAHAMACGYGLSQHVANYWQTSEGERWATAQDCIDYYKGVFNVDEGATFERAKDRRPELKLTALQVEILDHRLEVSDCVADALGEWMDKDGAIRSGWSADEVVEHCEWLQRLLAEKYRGGVIDLSRCFAVNPGLTVDVLRDCVEGSTFLCDMDDYVSAAKARGIRRSADELAEKISALIGQRVSMTHG